MLMVEMLYRPAVFFYYHQAPTKSNQQVQVLAVFDGVHRLELVIGHLLLRSANKPVINRDWPLSHRFWDIQMNWRRYGKWIFLSKFIANFLLISCGWQTPLPTSAPIISNVVIEGSPEIRNLSSITELIRKRWWK
jgi:hypothetical protein